MQACEPAPAQDDPLSVEYAFRLERTPGSGSVPAREAVAQAEKLRAAGYAAYRAGEDEQAIQKYLSALKLHASAAIYYQFGNSLMNVGRFADAAEAYQRSVMLYYERPELAFYNAACAYSRMENAPKAYELLALAFDRGYDAFAHVRKDPDLAYLRKQPDWETQLRALIPPEVEYDVESLKGLILKYTPRLPNQYYLCANGVSLEHVICEGGFIRGTWRIEAGDLVISEDTICTTIGEGRSQAGGACVYFERYRFAGCTPQKTPAGPKLLKNEIRRGLQQAVRGVEPEIEELGFRKYAADPVQCDPAFIPQSREDLTIEAFEDPFGDRQ
ncbi:MAG: hypothetical protein NXI24_24475 [bacterium]|nr:hypothetical protein [bacterium]